MAADNNDAQMRLLGQIEGMLKAQAETNARVEKKLDEMRNEWNASKKDHEDRIRALEKKDVDALAKASADLELRVRVVEKESTKVGVWAGIIASAIGILLTELMRRFIK